MIFSRRMKSSSSVGPRGVDVSEFWLSAIGIPCAVVRTGCLPPAYCWSSPPLPRDVSASARERRVALVGPGEDDPDAEPVVLPRGAVRFLVAMEYHLMLAWGRYRDGNGRI